MTTKKRTTRMAVMMRRRRRERMATKRIAITCGAFLFHFFEGPRATWASSGPSWGFPAHRTFHCGPAALGQFLAGATACSAFTSRHDLCVFLVLPHTSSILVHRSPCTPLRPSTSHLLPRPLVRQRAGGRRGYSSRWCPAVGGWPWWSARWRPGGRRPTCAQVHFFIFG